MSSIKLTIPDNHSYTYKGKIYNGEIVVEPEVAALLRVRHQQLHGQEIPYVEVNDDGSPIEAAAEPVEQVAKKEDEPVAEVKTDAAAESEPEVETAASTDAKTDEPEAVVDAPEKKASK